MEPTVPGSCKERAYFTIFAPPPCQVAILDFLKISFSTVSPAPHPLPTAPRREDRAPARPNGPNATARHAMYPRRPRRVASDRARPGRDALRRVRLGTQMLRIRKFGKGRCGYDARNTGLRHNRSLPRCRTGIGEDPVQMGWSRPHAAERPQRHGPAREVPAPPPARGVRTGPRREGRAPTRPVPSPSPHSPPCLPTSSCSALTGRRPIPLTPTHFHTRGRFALLRLCVGVPLTSSYTNRLDTTRRGRRGYIACRAMSMGIRSRRSATLPERTDGG